MEVTSRRRVPYRPERVLAQYFDLEHVSHVHPRTLGESRLITCKGRAVLFEQRWPWRFALGVRLCSTLKLELVAPGTVRVRVVRGLLRGSQLSVVLEESDGMTQVTETYETPLRLPAWLEAWLRQWLLKKIDEVWDEDLRVGLPHGGWPGIPPTQENLIAEPPLLHQARRLRRPHLIEAKELLDEL